ncbi:hypothetical protein [Celeribacter sp.]|uniref:hypothetical protein n=1 Tax=Celeribacter sp. TaxID=1890673 RepID=UPI003A8E4E4E
MVTHTRKIAVLTGDLVGSTALGPQKIEQAFEALKDCAEMQAAWMGDSLHFTRHRGDGWQVALTAPKYALRSALAFRAALRSLGREFDSYIGIAEGEIGATISMDLNDATGSAFVASGHLLDKVSQLSTTEKMAYGQNKALNAVVVLADHISQGWTPAQASAILPYLKTLDDPSFTDVAKALGKSRQSITKSLEAAALSPLRMALTSLEKGPYFD